MTSHRRVLLSMPLLLASTVGGGVQAQEKPRLTTADYGQWETLGREASLSPDGRWLAYPITRSNGQHELRVASTTGNERTVASLGETPELSADSRWLAHAIGYSEEERAELEKAGERVRNRMGLIDLTTLDTEIIESVAAFAFSDNGAYLAVHRHRVEADRATRDEDSDEESDPQGADLILRTLVTNADLTFANVSAFAWQDDGTLLAMTIAAAGRTGNGVQLYDAATGALRALDSNSALFSGLAWREDSDDLAVLRSRESDDHEDDTHVVLAWRELTGSPRAFSYDHGPDPTFAPDARIVADRPLEWSDDGASIFFGTKEWLRASPKGREEDAESTGGESSEDEDAAEVDVWHSRDRRIIPMQRVQEERDRRRSLLSVWHLEDDRVVPLGTDLMEEVSLLEGQAFAAVQVTDPYAFESMFGRRWMNVHLVDVQTGTRTKVIEKVRHFHGGSASGRFLLYFKDDQFWTYELASGRHANITGDLSASFANQEYDLPTRQRPSYGVAGWSVADDWVLLYDKYDVWRVAPDGSTGRNLTRGAAEEIRHRVVRLDEDASGLDLTQPLHVSLYGQWSKRHGYGRVRADDAVSSAEGSPVDRLIWADKQIDRLTKAKAADHYAYVIQTYDDSPDFFVGGPDLFDARQVSETNPFQAEFAWGRSELVDYRSGGRRLQGALFYPSNYEPGRQYPLIVYVYELRSQLVHAYVAPSERRPYNTSVFTNQGYFVLQPDIVYRDRDPGVSATECVVAAVETVLEMGMIDRERVGLVGHSWGGYEASFIPTQTDLFAAAVAGAPLTNFFSMFGTIHWNQGMPESSHFETGQARMDVPYWDDMEAYVRNSPVMFIRELDTPMLVAFGDADGTVDWHQGVELYNYARRAGKDLVMLVYAGENHSLRKKPNQVDYHHRVLDWLDHFLKGQDAPAWITDGVSVLERDRELDQRR